MRTTKQQVLHGVKVFLGVTVFLMVMTGMNDNNIDLVWSLF